MIIGRGMLAKKFSSYQKNQNILIFASGVANSQETDLLAFKREKDLLLDTMQTNTNAILVYFSTCSIYDLNNNHSPYIQHKLAMEEIIATNAICYYIFRLPQVIGSSSNQHTLINFLVNKIFTGESFPVWQHCTRNLIDIDDVYAIVNKIVQEKVYQNQIINIANLISLPITQIITILEETIGKKANCLYLDKGTPYPCFELTKIMPIVETLRIQFDISYYWLSIKKWLT